MQKSAPGRVDADADVDAPFGFQYDDDDDNTDADYDDGYNEDDDSNDDDDDIITCSSVFLGDPDTKRSKRRTRERLLKGFLLQRLVVIGGNTFDDGYMESQKEQ